MSLVRETKLNPIPIQTGYGIPSHISPAGSLYFDFIVKDEMWICVQPLSSNTTFNGTANVLYYL